MYAEKPRTKLWARGVKEYGSIKVFNYSYVDKATNLFRCYLCIELSTVNCDKITFNAQFFIIVQWSYLYMSFLPLVSCTMALYMYCIRCLAI